MFIHHDLRPNAEYRIQWADRVQKHLFGQGALTPQEVQTRMRARKALLDKVIIAESARWGDAQRGADTPLTRLDWLNATSYVIDNYVPERGSRVLAQLRADGLYPSFDAPTLSQYGGPISSGAEVVIIGQGGTIYYTLDGSDPRQIGGAVNPAAQTYTSSTETTTVLPLTQTWKYLADGSNQGTAWRSGTFDDAAWSSGAAELGYGDGDETTTVPIVDVDPVAAGDQKNATTYFRTSFNVADVTGITAATLRVKYDDAVVLYLNGVEVAKSPNIGSNPAHTQYASGGAPDENAYFDFTIDAAALVTGSNMLAAEVHQVDSGSSDISFSASLFITRTNTPTPLYLTGTGNRTLKVRALNSSEWSALVQADFKVRQTADMTVTLTTNGTFTAGGTASYTITARNSGMTATAGPVTVTTTLPAGLTATSLTGTGWTISQGIATRNDLLAAGTNYPPLTLTLSIAATAPALASVTSSVSGGGEITLSNNTDTDNTPIQSTGTSQILFSASAYEALEEGSNLSVTLLRTGSRAGSASVRLRTSDGTAKSVSDYSAVNEVITFADGEGSRTIDVGLNNDGRIETHESFTLNLSEATGAISLGLPNVATARILETDTKAPTVILTSPAEAARIVLPAVTLTGSAADDKGLGKVQVSLNGGTFADAVTTLDAKGTGAKWSLVVPAVAGANTVRVRAVDARGIISNEVVRSFTFVPLRPLALTITPADGGMVSGSQALLEVAKSYTLTAKAKPGFLFDRWTGPSINREALTLTFIMTEGLAIMANFLPTPVSPVNAGNYQGQVVSAIGVTRRQDNHGLISLKLTSAATFSGTLKLGESSHPFTGEVHPGGGARFGKDRAASWVIARAGRASLALSIQFNLSQRTFMGHVGEQTRSTVAAMSAFGGGLRRAALPTNSPLLTNRGMYEVKMTQVSPASGTPGYPVTAEKRLTGTLARSGNFTLVGTLSEGTKVTASADLLESGQMALFDLLDAKSGSLITTLSWSETTPGFSSSGGVWFKPVTNQGVFSFGWPDGLIFSIEGEP
jgi:uncharacterized repeat protein (TIGR01451 family)